MVFRTVMLSLMLLGLSWMSTFVESKVDVAAPARFGLQCNLLGMTCRDGWLQAALRLRFQELESIPSALNGLLNHMTASKYSVFSYSVLKSTTVDDLWKNYLQSSHIDFLKIDIDRQWAREDQSNSRPNRSRKKAENALSCSGNIGNRS